MATSTEERRQQTVRLGPVAYGGFPVRNLTRQANVTGGGEWITAYQADQKRRLKAVVSASIGRKTDSAAAVLRPPTNTREVSGVTRKALDEPFLLHHCYVEKPSDLCICNISGAGLLDYKPQDLTQFDGVVHIDASDNHLPLEAFRGFPALKSLELSLNQVGEVDIQLGDFSQLQTLDLSYNSLTGRSLLALGVLPSLTELHLTGNNLVALPVEMSRPFSTDGARSERTSFGMRFPSLERLWLDDNKLTDQATFATLAGLRRLKYLNLDNNEIYMIPQLRLIGASPLKAGSKRSRPPTTSRRGATPTIMEEDEPSETEPPENREKSVPSLMRQEGAEHRDPASAGPPHGHRPGSPRIGSPVRRTATPTGQVDPPPSSSEMRDRLADFMAPFPQLETLSLVNNLILSSEGLLACASWPALKKLIIYDNPLTRITRGMPQLLDTHLVKQRGVAVIRHRPGSQRQYTIGKAARDFIKVSTAAPPAIPRHTLPPLPALEGPPLPALEPPPPPPLPAMLEPPSLSPPSSSSSSNRSSSSPGSVSSESGELWMEEKEKERHQGVFLTQAAGEEQLPSDSSSVPAPDSPSNRQHARPTATEPWSAEDQFQARRQLLRERYQDAPKCFHGYELLLDTYDDPSLPIPNDVHSCTRALQHALRHPVAMGDPKASRHSVKSPGEFLKRKPSLGSVQSGHQLTSSVRNLHAVLDDIRTRCIALEANLNDTIHPKTTPTRTTEALQRDSRQLLSEMQARYDRVRASSLHALRPLSSEEGRRPGSLTTPTRIPIPRTPSGEGRHPQALTTPIRIHSSRSPSSEGRRQSPLTTPTRLHPSKTPEGRRQSSLTTPTRLHPSKTPEGRRQSSLTTPTRLHPSNIPEGHRPAPLTTPTKARQPPSPLPHSPDDSMSTDADSASTDADSSAV